MTRDLLHHRADHGQFLAQIEQAALEFGVLLAQTPRLFGEPGDQRAEFHEGRALVEQQVSDLVQRTHLGVLAAEDGRHRFIETRHAAARRFGLEVVLHRLDDLPQFLIDHGRPRAPDPGQVTGLGAEEVVIEGRAVPPRGARLVAVLGLDQGNQGLEIAADEGGGRHHGKSTRALRWARRSRAGKAQGGRTSGKQVRQPGSLPCKFRPGAPLLTHPIRESKHSQRADLPRNLPSQPSLPFRLSSLSLPPKQQPERPRVGTRQTPENALSEFVKAEGLEGERVTSVEMRIAHNSYSPKHRPLSRRTPFSLSQPTPKPSLPEKGASRASRHALGGG